MKKKHLNYVWFILLVSGFVFRGSAVGKFLRVPWNRTTKFIHLCWQFTKANIVSPNSSKRWINPCTGIERNRGFNVEVHRFQENRHVKVKSLSALCNGRIYRQQLPLILISVWGGVDPRTIARPEWLCQWTHDFPACSAVSQPTTLPRAPFWF